MSPFDVTFANSLGLSPRYRCSLSPPLAAQLPDSESEQMDDEISQSFSTVLLMTYVFMYVQIYIYIWSLSSTCLLYVDFSFLQLSVLFLDSARCSYIFKQILKHQAILANKSKVKKFPHRSRFYLLSQKYLTVPQTNTNPHSKRNNLGKSMFYNSEGFYI